MSSADYYNQYAPFSINSCTKLMDKRVYLIKRWWSNFEITIVGTDPFAKLKGELQPSFDS